MIKLPSGINKNNLINDLRVFSLEASEILLKYSRILKDSKNKSNILRNNNLDDPVTLADLKVNEMIINRINEKYHNIDWKILSEENVKLPKHEIDTKGDWLWVLDPLDGTKDFIQGTGNYAMHLALTYKQKAYIGVVLIPEKGELWIADGEKVWCEKKNNSNMRPNLLSKNSLREFNLVTSKNHGNETLKKLIEKIEFNKIIVMGSIGCKISSILRGESDIYISLSLPGKSAPKDWDFAAPAAIIKAAGGAITNLDNQELLYGKSNFEQRGIIVATGDCFKHKTICSEIKGIIRKHDLYPC